MGSYFICRCYWNILPIAVSYSSVHFLSHLIRFGGGCMQPWGEAPYPLKFLHGVRCAPYVYNYAAYALQLNSAYRVAVYRMLSRRMIFRLHYALSVRTALRTGLLRFLGLWGLSPRFPLSVVF
jgi:hypothetical protein